MFTTTLICKPGTNAVTSNLAEALRGAWGGRDLCWLDPLNAVEFEVLNRPENLWAVWGDLQSAGVDLVLQPTNNRRKLMLLADMDSTMIHQECIDELAAEAGFGPQVAAITARAMNGELDFEDAVIERVGMLKDLPLSVIDDVFEKRITMMPGGAVLLTTMKANGAHAALVSGGFTSFTSKVATALGFDENRANTLIDDGSKLTGEIGRPILGQAAKVEALAEITTRLNLTPADVLAVGDGANDLGMLTRAGTGVALHAKPVVQEQCDVRVNHGDLTALLFIQGYAKSDFVT